MQALQFCVAKGANVYVTSSKAEKIDQAKQYGAKGGVNYKDEDWPQQLAALLPKERPSLDAVIDAAGGDIITAVLKLLKFGARVAVYGQCVDIRPFHLDCLLTDTSSLLILPVEQRRSRTFSQCSPYRRISNFEEPQWAHVRSSRRPSSSLLNTRSSQSYMRCTIPWKKPTRQWRIFERAISSESLSSA